MLQEHALSVSCVACSCAWPFKKPTAKQLLDTKPQRGGNRALNDIFISHREVPSELGGRGSLQSTAMSGDTSVVSATQHCRSAKLADKQAGKLCTVHQRAHTVLRAMHHCALLPCCTRHRARLQPPALTESGLQKHCSPVWHAAPVKQREREIGDYEPCQFRVEARHVPVTVSPVIPGLKPPLHYA